MSALDEHAAGALLTETASRSTWENVRNVIPLVEHPDRIKVGSYSRHAEKGRAYLGGCGPIRERLDRAEEYRFGELIC